MQLYREGFSWQQWVHVSKYPPSMSYIFLELGIMSAILAMMITLEKIIGTRQNGVLLVFGQTSMMFYLVHRLFLTGTANFADMKKFTDLPTTYVITLIMLILLYPFCLWYRGFKAKHLNSI